MSKKPNKLLASLGIHSLKDTLATYNPWWSTKKFPLPIPEFKRDAFAQALRHTEANHGLALLINGPRRIGKTTMINQIIKYLIDDKKTPANHILFFSLDDPIIQQLPPREQGALFEAILSQWAQIAGSALRTSPNMLYCFLDEVQRLPRWELYLKRYIDLRYPIRFVISGSASHTIFRKSLESLLGRLVDISLPPFTFREYVRFHYPEHAGFLQTIAEDKLDIGDISAIKKFIKTIEPKTSPENIRQWNIYAEEYANSGGFPQLWEMSATSERASFVDQQFVERVTLEDLRLVREIRRPEIFHKFLRYAFARTGEEYNLEKVAELIQTTRVTLTDALPLLLQTELIRKVERFTGKPVRLRSTHAKLYAADPMLMQAITKIPTSLEGQDRGRIAETLVHNTIRLFPGISDISYFRESRGESEIDFIIRIGSKIVPIEVCYQSNIDTKHHNIPKEFLTKHTKESDYGILITKNSYNPSLPIIEIPLPFFLLTS